MDFCNELQKMTGRRKIILIQKRDIKSQKWSEAMPAATGIHLQPVDGSPFHIPIALLCSLFSPREYTAGVVFRYLNDYSSLGKTLLRLAAEFTTIAIARISFVRIGWICHNVDRESLQHYPRIAHLRRWMIIRASRRVYVTSDLLVDSCASLLNIPHRKIGVTTFGTFSRIIECRPSKFENEVLDWIEEWKRINVRVGLWIGSAAEKSLSGLDGFLKLINNKQGNLVAGLVIGVDENWIREKISDDALTTLAQKNIRIIPSMHFGISLWREFDFIWKPCDDLSTTITSLIAAEAGVPLVVYRNSYLQTFVENFGCGISVDYENIDTIKFLDSLQRIGNIRSNVFETNTWERGALALSSLCETKEE
jgi:hypothetical protein